MSTVTLIRSSSAPSHHAMVLPIDMPTVPIRAVSTSGRCDQPVERAQAVVDHHSPQHPALPEHGLEHVELAGVAALAEHPVVDAEDGVAEIGQRLRVRHRLQIGAALEKLLLADGVAAAVRVVEDDAGVRPGALRRPRHVGRNGLDPVEIEVPRLEDDSRPRSASLALARRRSAAADRADRRATRTARRRLAGWSGLHGGAHYPPAAIGHRRQRRHARPATTGHAA